MINGIKKIKDLVGGDQSGNPQLQTKWFNDWAGTDIIDI